MWKLFGLLIALMEENKYPEQDLLRRRWAHMGWGRGFEHRLQQLTTVFRALCACVCRVCVGCGWAQSRSSEPLPPHSPPRLPSHRNFVITSSLGLKQTQHSTTLCNLFVWSSPWRHRSWGREGGRGQTAGSMWGASSKSSFNSGTENKMPFPKASWANTTLHWWSSVTETQSRGHLGGH